MARTRPIALLLAAALSSALPRGALALEVRILLLNDSSDDLSVEAADGTVRAEVGSKQGKAVSFQGNQRLRFGKQGFEYRIDALEALARADAAPVVLQANANRALYVMPKGTRSPRLTVPPQPSGFPLRPARRLGSD